MKVIFERQALLSAVNLVAGVVPARTPTPALSCLKVVATKAAGVGQVLISGTDGETSIQLAIAQVDVAQPGTAVIPADKLRQIVQAVENETTLTLDLEGDICHIKGASSRFKIFAYPADQYPAFPEFAAVASRTGAQAPRSQFTHSEGGLLTLINRTVFATARETSRYAINGVLFKRDGKKLEMVATDGRRLALSRSTLRSTAGTQSAEGTPTTCIVPTKALNLFARLATSPDDPVRVAITDNRIFFAFEDALPENPDGTKKGKAAAAGAAAGGESRPRAVLSSALVEGAFPPYEDVIPKDLDKRMTAERDGFAAAIREAAILTNEESRGIRLTFSGKEKSLKLNSRAPEMGESEIDFEVTAYEGDDLEISFNPAFLTDALKSVDTGDVILELKAPNKPGVLRSGTEFLYVVMPVNLPQ